MLENNHIIGLTFEGVNPVTEIWHKQMTSERGGSLNFSSNQHLYLKVIQISFAEGREVGEMDWTTVTL